MPVLLYHKLRIHDGVLLCQIPEVDQKGDYISSFSDVTVSNKSNKQAKRHNSLAFIILETQ